MTFHRDDSKPPNDIHRYYSLATCTGQSDGIALEVPKHWHKHHDEYMTCVEGSIELYLDGKTVTATPSNPTIFIERRQVHGFKFPKGQRAVLKEMTMPTGEFKQKFFEDIFENWGFWGAMRGFADGDTYPALLPGPFRWLDEIYILVLWVLVRLVYPRKGDVPMSVAPLTLVEDKKAL